MYSLLTLRYSFGSALIIDPDTWFLQTLSHSRTETTTDPVWKQTQSALGCMLTHRKYFLGSIMMYTVSWHLLLLFYFFLLGWYSIRSMWKAQMVNHWEKGHHFGPRLLLSVIHGTTYLLCKQRREKSRQSPVAVNFVEWNSESVQLSCQKSRKSSISRPMTHSFQIKKSLARSGLPQA